MTFYHGTTEEAYEKIVNEGILYGIRGIFQGREMDRCTYLAVNVEEAKQYGPVLLQVEYDPFVNNKYNNYEEGCWQVRVYEPIPLQNIIKL